MCIDLLQEGEIIMTINKTETGDKIIFEIEGRVDTTTSSELQSTLAPEVTNTDDMVLDCKKLIYISSAGLRVLLSVHKSMIKKGGKFSLTNVSEDILEIFEITGFSNILNIN